MGVSAILKYARLSDQKGRLVADQIRGLAVDKALEILSFSQKKAALIIKKVLESVIANAENNNGMDIDELKISKICINQAPSFKRFKARAKGRGNRIIKRNCHILIELDSLKVKRG